MRALPILLEPRSVFLGRRESADSYSYLGCGVGVNLTDTNLLFDLGVLMRKTKTTLAQIAAIAMLSVGAIALSSATVGAAVDLSQSDLSSIANAVDGAIASAKAGLPAGATEAQINAAVAA